MNPDSVWTPGDATPVDHIRVEVARNGEVTLINVTKVTSMVVRSASLHARGDDGGKAALLYAVDLAEMLDVDLTIYPSLISTLLSE